MSHLSKFGKRLLRLKQRGFHYSIHQSATASLAYDAYHNCDDFHEKYLKQFDQTPYTSPPNQRLCSLAKTLGTEDRDKGFERIEILKAWLQGTVLAGKHTNALVILSIESMTPRHRDYAPAFKRPPQHGINTLALAAVLKSPAFTVPIIQIPYHSNVTGREEMLPFSVALMSSPGE
ncbi:uncharacterized protein TRUGW13939_11398 [Talaromyces rugulosus]|uniref:Uncharacterized protein n=1 Tax=Talaromyces rugulosus TaxID=121627 RepID=A0A7H8RF87_TALRU|nr:uncharacterized protein TRUGW13939_11398 [Talaromyces rugulosus]QKX64225.1 hypothetical protein TRUGW13939_11398 [Talaromyces rugulosus]